MKRILPVVLVLLIMLVSIPALAYGSTIESVVELTKAYLPENSEDYTIDVRYDAAADIVIMEWVLTTIDSDTYFSYSSMLTTQLDTVFDSLCETTSSLKELLVTADCPQSALCLLKTSDGIPIGVICNGQKISVAR